jgi:hypothetical protein
MLLKQNLQFFIVTEGGKLNFDTEYSISTKDSSTLIIDNIQNIFPDSDNNIELLFKLSTLQDIYKIQESNPIKLEELIEKKLQRYETNIIEENIKEIEEKDINKVLNLLKEQIKNIYQELSKVNPINFELFKEILSIFNIESKFIKTFSEIAKINNSSINEEGLLSIPEINNSLNVTYNMTKLKVEEGFPSLS